MWTNRMKRNWTCLFTRLVIGWLRELEIVGRKWRHLGRQRWHRWRRTKVGQQRLMDILVSVMKEKPRSKERQLWLIWAEWTSPPLPCLHAFWVTCQHRKKFQHCRKIKGKGVRLSTSYYIRFGVPIICNANFLGLVRYFCPQLHILKTSLLSICSNFCYFAKFFNVFPTIFTEKPYAQHLLGFLNVRNIIS